MCARALFGCRELKGGAENGCHILDYLPDESDIRALSSTTNMRCFLIVNSSDVDPRSVAVQKMKTFVVVRGRLRGSRVFVVDDCGVRCCTNS